MADAGLQREVTFDYNIGDIEPILMEKLGNATFPALQHAPVR